MPALSPVSKRSPEAAQRIPGFRSSYDANGNQTGKTQGTVQWTYGYDARDELTGITQTDTSSGSPVTTTVGQYRYDADGLRTDRQSTATGSEHYTWDDHSLLLTFDDAGTYKARYRYGPMRLESLNTGSGAVPMLSWYFFDALGSVTDVLGNSGSLDASYRYDAWGRQTFATGASVNQFGFTGHQRDAESGLSYFKARFYDPDVGRFLTEDSFEGKQDTPPSLHRYLYAYDNPEVYWDADGHDAIAGAAPEAGPAGFMAWGVMEETGTNDRLRRIAGGENIDFQADAASNPSWGNSTAALGDRAIRWLRNPSVTIGGTTYSVEFSFKKLNKLKAFITHEVDDAPIITGTPIDGPVTIPHTGHPRPEIKLGPLVNPGHTEPTPSLPGFCEGCEPSKGHNTGHGDAGKVDASTVMLSEKVDQKSSAALSSKDQAAQPNKNTNTAQGNFGVYEIYINGELHKIGKADLDRITQSSGQPTRLHQQIRRLRETNPGDRVEGEVVEEGYETTAQAKAAESARLQSNFDRTHTVPKGNERSFRPDVRSDGK